MRRLNIAMLSQQTQEPIVQTQTELDVVGQQAEDDLLQVNQIQAEIDSRQQAIADAEEITQQAQEEVDIMTQAQLDGGAQKASMESLKRFMVRAEKRTGISSSISSMSMESFSDRKHRARSTTVAMEGVVAFIEETLKSLQDAVGVVWDSVKRLYQKAVDAFDKLIVRARELGNKAKSLFGKKADADASIELASVNEIAQVDGERVEGKTFVQKLSEAFSKEGAYKAYESVKEFLKNRTIYKKFMEFIGKGDKTKIAEAIAEMAPESDRNEDDMGIVTTPSLLGNYKLKITTFAKKSYEYIKQKIANIKASFSKEDKPELDTGVKPLTPEECEQVTKTVITTIDNAKQMKDVQSEFEKAVGEIDSMVAPKTGEEDSTDMARTTSSAIRTMINNAMGILSSATTYISNTVKGALDYVAESLRLITSNGKKDNNQSSTQVVA